MTVNIEEKAALYYSKGWWTLANLESLVVKGKLSETAMRRIVGADDADEESAEEEVA